MNFVLVKAFSAALYPVFSSILAIAVGLVLKRYWKKIGYLLIVIGIGYLYLCSTRQFGSMLASKLESGYEYIEPNELSVADAIIVLGGGVGRSKGALELKDSADRVFYGARLLKAGKAPYIVVTAGSGYGTRPHSEAMIEFLVELGVSTDVIVEENQALNTYEHALYLAPIFEEREIRSVILVTSSWHMRRSLAVFESQLPDLEITPFSVDSEAGKTRSVVDFLPTVEGLSKTSKVMKEYIGYAIYDLRGWID